MKKSMISMALCCVIAGTVVSLTAEDVPPKITVSQCPKCAAKSGQVIGAGPGGKCLTCDSEKDKKTKDISQVSLSFSCKDLPIAEAIKKLSKESKVPIEVDEKAAKQCKSHLGSKISKAQASYSKSTVAQQLEVLLSGSPMVFHVKDGKILIKLANPSKDILPEKDPDRKKGAPGALIVARFKERKGIRTGGLNGGGRVGAHFWFDVISVKRFDREKKPRDQFIYNRFLYPEMKKRLGMLEKYNKLDVVITYGSNSQNKTLANRIADLDKTLKPGSVYILAWKSTGEFSFDGLVVPGKLGQIDGKRGLIIPFTEESLKNIDKIFASKKGLSNNPVSNKEVSAKNIHKFNDAELIKREEMLLQQIEKFKKK